MRACAIYLVISGDLDVAVENDIISSQPNLAATGFNENVAGRYLKNLAF